MSERNAPIRAIAVVGPTASGKTALSIALARRLGGEIISCDSMQIYRGMDIGTAKATEEERAAIPHHMIDILPPNAPYSAADYGEDAYRTACALTARGVTPIFCGGTGLYLNAACTALHENAPMADEAIRARLTAIGQSEEGKTQLFERLTALDPEEAQKTHKNNVRRVVRALEIYELTGKPKSLFDRESKAASPRIRLLPILLDFRDRQLLYRRIEARVDDMMANGLAAEVRALFEKGLLAPDTTAGQAIGYKELYAYAVLGTVGRETAMAELKTATRRYAKRQLTWFRAMEGILTVCPDREDGTLKSADELAYELDAPIRAFLES